MEMDLGDTVLYQNPVIFNSILHQLFEVPTTIYVALLIGSELG